MDDNLSKQRLHQKRTGYHTIQSKKLRDKIIKSFDNRCGCCGATDKLSIHHTDFNHNNNREDNLVLLCHSCHNKQHCPYKKIGVSVALDPDIILAIDKVRRQERQTRSQFIKECILKNITLEDVEGE